MLETEINMNYKNIAYSFEELPDAPYTVVRILNECWEDYSNGNLGDGERMASGMDVREDFIRRLKQIGYDELKYNDIADTLEYDVDENNSHLASNNIFPHHAHELTLKIHPFLFRKQDQQAR